MSELVVHQLPGAWGLPSISPFCLKHQRARGTTRSVTVRYVQSGPVSLDA